MIINLLKLIESLEINEFFDKRYKNSNPTTKHNCEHGYLYSQIIDYLQITNK